MEFIDLSVACGKNVHNYGVAEYNTLTCINFYPITKKEFYRLLKMKDKEIHFNYGVVIITIVLAFFALYFKNVLCGIGAVIAFFSIKINKE
jgi:hypothetical protein